MKHDKVTSLRTLTKTLQAPLHGNILREVEEDTSEDNTIDSEPSEDVYEAYGMSKSPYQNTPIITQERLEIKQRNDSGYFVPYSLVTLTGYIADLAIHWNDNNPHAHVLLTTREIDENGFGKKNRDWNKKELLDEWRENWSDHNNQWLEQNGKQERVDHRTLEKQGIDREPTKHIGRDAWYAHQKGEETERWSRLEQREQHYGGVNQFLEASNQHFRENPYEHVTIVNRLRAVPAAR